MLERRHLRYFKPSPAAILSVLRCKELLLNHQICAEALELVLKKHTIALSCGPFVLTSLLRRIEQHELGKLWLSWLRSIELEWETFPYLLWYPPNWQKHELRDWDGESDKVEADVDYPDVRDGPASTNHNEHDYEGPGYDDNMYNPSDMELYPVQPDDNPALVHKTNPTDPFGLNTHDPFTRPTSRSEERRVGKECPV